MLLAIPGVLCYNRTREELITLSKALAAPVRILKTLLEGLRWIIIVLAVALIILSLLRIRFYVVMTGSMTPTIPVGSICMVNHNVPFEQIAQGDIISFRTGDAANVTHRAVRITQEGIITQGDANTVEDAAPVTADNYLGKTILHIPKIGYALLFLNGRIGRVIVAVIIMLCICSLFLPGSGNGANQEQAPD